jgi:hypothetical protein
LLPNEKQREEMTMENPRTALKLFWIVLASIAVGAVGAIVFHVSSN